MAPELESDLQDTVDRGRKWLVDFNAGKSQLVLCDWFDNTGVIDVKMDGSILEYKSSFKKLGMTFCSKLDWGSCTISIAKTTYKKIGALICSMKFLSSEVALYLYKSTICPCMEYCCHVWANSPGCYLVLLDKLQTWICRTSLALSLEPLAYCRNVEPLAHSSELSELVPLLYSQRKSTRYSDKLHDFSVTISRCYKDVYATVSFLAQLALEFSAYRMLSSD